MKSARRKLNLAKNQSQEKHFREMLLNNPPGGATNSNYKSIFDATEVEG